MDTEEKGVLVDTENLLDWFKARAKENGGLIPRFTNPDAMAHLGKTDRKRFGRLHGQVQSRIDFACFKCSLPPLGLAADKPFDGAWSPEDRFWVYPVERMMVAAQSRKWTDEDFETIRREAALLPASAAISWRVQLRNNAEAVKGWAESYASTAGNPHVPYLPPKRNWTTDELILALELYLADYREKSADDKHDKVIELSKMLNELGRVLGTRTGNGYRNPNGVSMKLLNFSSLDPKKTGQGKAGLKQVSKLDRRVWDRFALHPEELRKTADAIRSRLKEFARTGHAVGGDEEPDLQEAPEGRLLTRTHRVRERQPKLVKACKKRAKELYGYLACAACGFNFGEVYGDDADHIIDCHHTKPVHTLDEDGKTHIDDLELLCSNCHRVVHSFSPWLSIPELKNRLGRQTT